MSNKPINIDIILDQDKDGVYRPKKEKEGIRTWVWYREQPEDVEHEIVQPNQLTDGTKG